jgi:hypothetical protein
MTLDSLTKALKNQDYDERRDSDAQPTLSRACRLQTKPLSRNISVSTTRFAWKSGTSLEELADVPQPATSSEEHRVALQTMRRHQFW